MNLTLEKVYEPWMAVRKAKKTMYGQLIDASLKWTVKERLKLINGQYKSNSPIYTLPFIQHFFAQRFLSTINHTLLAQSSGVI